MKTLADFKRAMKVGTRWRVVVYNYFDDTLDSEYHELVSGSREVTRVNSVCFWVKSIDGTNVDICTDFGKSSYFGINSNGCAIFKDYLGRPLLSYRLIYKPCEEENDKNDTEE